MPAFEGEGKLFDLSFWKRHTTFVNVIIELTVTKIGFVCTVGNKVAYF
jgi:hypothetical protein